MSVFLREFLSGSGIRAFDVEKMQEKQFILIGDSVENFASFLEYKGVDIERVSGFLLHPLHFNPYKNIIHYLYEVGCEEAVIALLANTLKEGKCEKLESFTQNLDIGNLASECNLSEEELEEIARISRSEEMILLIGKDIQTHKNAQNIARILALLSQSLERVKIVFLESCNEKVSLKEQEILPLAEFDSYDGLVVYLQDFGENILEASRQFCNIAKVVENMQIKIVFLDSNKEIEAKVVCNTALKGMVGILKACNVRDDSFCYKQVKVSKVA